MHDLRRYPGTPIPQIDALCPLYTFVFLCFGTRFLFFNPLSWPGANCSQSEALAPGHGRDGPWPHSALAPGVPRGMAAIVRVGMQKLGWTTGSEELWGAGG